MYKPRAQRGRLFSLRNESDVRPCVALRARRHCTGCSGCHTSGTGRYGVFVPEVDNFTYARAVQQPALGAMGVADGRGSYFTHYRGNYG